MEIKELRIGNLVKTRKQDYFTKKGITEVKSIDYDSINSYNDGRVSDKNELENLSGIPLTEEWYLKFGFEKRGNFKTIFTPCGKALVFISDFIVFCGIAVEIPILYVHQLQNLYFALTGDELTIKN